VGDQIERITSLRGPLFNDPGSGEIVMNEIVVLGSVITKDFFVNLVEGHSLSNSLLNVSNVTGQVVFAKIDTDTVKIVIEIVEGHAHRVSSSSHNIVNNATVDETNRDQVRSSREDSVEPVQDSQNVLSEIFRSGSLAEADIVGSEFHNDQQGLIGGLVSIHKLGVVISTTTSSSRDGDILIIAEVTSVSFQQVLVNTVNRTVVAFVFITSVGTELRMATLIEPGGDDVGESGLIPISGGGEFVGDLGENTSRVTDNNNTHFVSVGTQNFLPILASFGILSGDTVAVVINSLARIGVDASSGVDLGIKIVAVTPSPVISSSKGHGRRVMVTIVINKGNLGVADFLQVLEEFNQGVGVQLLGGKDAF